MTSSSAGLEVTNSYQSNSCLAGNELVPILFKNDLQSPVNYIFKVSIIEPRVCSAANFDLFHQRFTANYGSNLGTSYLNNKPLGKVKIFLKVLSCLKVSQDITLKKTMQQPFFCSDIEQLCQLMTSFVLTIFSHPHES